MDHTELIDLAREQEEDRIANWISEQVEADVAAREAEAAAPIETPAGQIIPGHTYNITFSKRRGPDVVLRRVVPERGRWGWGQIAFVYASGSRRNLWPEELARITKIEEIP